ncbi:MAG: hypothetical protein IPG67_16030 [Acidobacteria bacterium]|nr:hypothetical protein [Acidobacteriota bacterium]
MPVFTAPHAFLENLIPLFPRKSPDSQKKIYDKSITISHRSKLISPKNDFICPPQPSFSPKPIFNSPGQEFSAIFRNRSPAKTRISATEKLLSLTDHFLSETSFLLSATNQFLSGTSLLLSAKNQFLQSRSAALFEEKLCFSSKTQNKTNAAPPPPLK